MSSRASISKPPKGVSARRSFVFLCLFMTPFFAVGLFFLYAGIQNWLSGNSTAGMAVCGFATVFLLFSSGFLFMGWRGFQRGRKQEQLEVVHAEEPWLWREDWATGVIRSAGKGTVWFAWVIALFWNGISSPLLFVFSREWEKGNKLILIGLIFPLIGLLILVWAIYRTVQYRKFGQSLFRMLSVPGVLGGSLSGAVEVPSKVRADKGFKLRLHCVQRTTTGSGKNRSTHEQLLWEDEKTILRDLLEHERGRTAIPVHFNIPYELPSSLEGNPAIVWRLEILADIPGVDYSAQFEVPVFKTPQSDPERQPAEDPTAAFQPPPQEYQPPAKSRIQARDIFDGVELYFPAARNPGGIAALLVFLAIWNAIFWVLMVKKAPIIFPIVWGLADTILMLALLSALFYSVRVQATKSQLSVYHRMLFPTCTRRLPSSEIKSVQARPGAQAGRTVYYQIRVQTRDGKEYHAGEGIPDRRHAEWLASRIATALGVNSK